MNSLQISTRAVSVTTDVHPVRAFAERPAMQDSQDGPLAGRTSPDELFSYFTASVIKEKIIRPGKSTVKL